MYQKFTSPRDFCDALAAAVLLYTIEAFGAFLRMRLILSENIYEYGWV